MHLELRVHAAHGGHQRLRGHLTAVDPRSRRVRLAAAEQVDIEVLEVEERDEVTHVGVRLWDVAREVGGFGAHGSCLPGSPSVPSSPARNCSN